MVNLNKVLLMGNLTREPQSKALQQTGTPICDMAMAVNRRYKTQSGEEREDVIYVDLTAYGNQADYCVKNMTKGSAIYVEGHLRLDSWQDKETGKNRSKLRVVVDNIIHLDRKSTLVPEQQGYPPMGYGQSSYPAPAYGQPMPTYGYQQPPPPYSPMQQPYQSMPQQPYQPLQWPMPQPAPQQQVTPQQQAPQQSAPQAAPQPQQPAQQSQVTTQQQATQQSAPQTTPQPQQPAPQQPAQQPQADPPPAQPPPPQPSQPVPPSAAANEEVVDDVPF